jgi:hypothetical protein
MPIILEQIMYSTEWSQGFCRFNPYWTVWLTFSLGKKLPKEAQYNVWLPSFNQARTWPDVKGPYRPLTGCEGRNRTQQAQDRVQWLTLVNKVTNLRFYKRQGIS